MEQSRKLDDHNLISAFMLESGNKDLETALNTMDMFNRQTVTSFLSTTRLLPSWGKEIDAEVKFYIDGIGNWVRGEDCWSFECGRYFEGGIGEEVMINRKVTLASPSQGYVGRSGLSM